MLVKALDITFCLMSLTFSFFLSPSLSLSFSLSSPLLSSLPFPLFLPPHLSLSGGISNAKHAMLLVGTKMLAVVGRSPQLPTADTLLLTLLVANMYYHSSRPTSSEGKGTVQILRG